MNMAWAGLALFPVVSVLLSSNIADHGRDENWRRCADADAATSIAGCTALIEPGREAADNQATVFDNRGLAYTDKGDYERAIADFNAAIVIKPDYAFAFSNRGVANTDKGQYDR